MNLSKKGQAAMEFIMTYGWAILVVLAAIGALAYFGVLNPSSALPSSCTIAPGVSCDDFKVSSSSVQLVLRNGFGNDFTAVGVSVTGCTADSNADGDDSWKDGSQLGGTGGITLTGCSNGESGARFKQDVNITYTSTSGVTHSLAGLVTSKVE
jgi:hypothetical protein